MTALRPRLTLPAVALLTVLLTVIGTGPAAAHTELETAVPEDGGVVADPPIEVVLTFTQPLADPEAAQVEVIDPAGDDLVAAPPTVDGAVVTVPLNLAVAEGAHEVRWVVIAQDGHRLEGTTTFTFAPPSEIATPPDAEPTASEDPTEAPTADPTDAPSPTATETASAAPSPPPPTPDPSVTASEETAASSDGGISPTVGILLAALAMAAVGAVVVMRVRTGGGLG